MADTCTRSITFDIQGQGKLPAVRVLAVEKDGNIEFTLTVLDKGGKTADLRGLFFDFNDLLDSVGLSITGSDVTNFKTGDVIDMGRGVNMHGHASPFDVGIEFGTPGKGKDDIHSTSFTLSGTRDLTLDDIAQVEFGARLDSIGNPNQARGGVAKLVTLAPAAPDARDDSYGIYEDGQAGLDSPSTVPQGIIFELLDNDTDADGDILTITRVEGAQHGTVEIIDGDDADSLVGDAVLYTPFEDYAGTDDFTYCITDNNGGTDFAQVAVAITAVADIPNLTVEVLDPVAGDEVNMVRLRVTATQTDADSSEYIDRILSSNLPEGVTLTPVTADPPTEPDQLVQDYLLTLPLEQDSNFDLTFTAVSKETSNGDEEVNTKSVNIEYEYNSNDLDRTFTASDQSMWGTGDDFEFDDERFIGIDTSWDKSGGGFVYGATNGYLTAGFDSSLHFEGGSVDASLPYDITVETLYNKTSDVLRIDSNAFVKPGAALNTFGPEGDYVLDFIFEFYASVQAGLDFGELGTVDLFNLGIGPLDYGLNILDVDSEDLAVEVPLPAGSSLTFAWPNLDTNGTSTGTVVSTSGASNNFLELDVDFDGLVFSLLGLPNPFDIGFNIGVAWGNIELADLDFLAGLNFLQDFQLSANGLPGLIKYEDGTEDSFVFGTEIMIDNASSLDVDNNGTIGFSLKLDPEATLNNNTDLGLNLGYLFEAFKLSGGYDVFLLQGEFSLGPVFSVGETFPVATIGVYDENFALDFAEQTVTFSA